MPVSTPAPKMRGRHRAATPKDIKKAAERFAAFVPSDIRAAVQRAVEATGQTYRPEDWTFGLFDGLTPGWIVSRPEAGPHKVLVVAPDGRTAWSDGQQGLGSMLDELTQSAALSRSQIEWLLFDQSRLFRGAWHIEPVGDLGWVCSRETKVRGRLHFVVASNGTFIKVPRPLSSLGNESVLFFLLAGDEDAAARVVRDSVS